MDIYNFIILQVMAHFFADFYCQSDIGAEDKDNNGFGSRYLYLHALIVFVISWILSFQLSFIIGSMVIATTHFFLDGAKKNIYQHESLKNKVFFIDQFFHFLIIVIVVITFNKFCDITMILNVPLNLRYLVIILAYVMIIKPSNFFIKEIFTFYKITIPDGNNGTPQQELINAGKLIGDCERILTLTLILCNHIEVVGFLLAAKSILRYRDSETVKTEYVLTGTLLSFGIAILLGLAVQYLK